MSEYAAMIDAPPRHARAMRPTAYAGVLAATTGIQIIATTAILALGALAPVMAAALGVPASAVGYQVSLIYFAGIFSSAIAGGLIGRFGPVRIEQATLLGAALGFLAMASGNVVAIAAGSVASGIGYGLNNPASSAILARVTPAARRNLVFSIKQAGVPLGGFTASLLVPIAADAIGWRPALLILVLVTSTGMILLGWHRDDHVRRRVQLFRGVVGEQRLIWRDRGLTALAITGMLFSAAQLSLGAFTIQLLVHECGWSLIAAGAAAAGMQAAGAVGRIAWGHVADRTGRSHAGPGNDPGAVLGIVARQRGDILPRHLRRRAGGRSLRSTHNSGHRHGGRHPGRHR